MIDKIKTQVEELLKSDNSGHGMEHINRVLDLSLKFAKEENANIEIVSLIALLHDVDDYKLFGEQNAIELTNAKMIMNNCNIADEIQQQVLSSLKCIGYSKAINNIRPTTLEGMIVSDADMCDALGVNGILRTHQYALKNDTLFFDKNIFPVEALTASEYKKKCSDTGVCHMFEKILKLKKMMMTSSGKNEASERHQIVVDILYHLFDEENALEWKEYLDKFLKDNY